ncbi:bifunctional (p)ppGpp synthetase/guanosine-3',5'-bis(diphosphate) 3'-pyrophosphohydrolase [Candidatus Woesearchaeota archaeon]|nr:bifunctional (p)ppGpp synthetase/guanosine-3',5'-bis(diphosphate) 3'-pyrophosphohydrolase [Candidatus Woesearchaeota archaeon]
MNEIQGIISKISAYDPNANITLIKKAYNFAKEAHKGQKRLSGKEFLTHPVGVSDILLDMRADSATIIAALLHDVVEESEVTLHQIQKEFGEEIATLVEGETKSAKIVFESPEAYTAENLRKILLATIKDIRVILIKLADRLHNMRTLKYFREDKQKRIAKETMEIYAPLAHKLGMYSLKGELEDLSLRYLKPETYQDLKQKVNEKREEREKKAEMLMGILREQLKENKIDFIEVSGRAKYFYSIYKKMIVEKKTFEEIYDLIAVRIVVKEIPDCYRVVALVHQLWKPVPGRFKDYIAVPKSNGYQSLHTDVATPFGCILEVQARTLAMHYVAKYGVAAHWRYKGTERDKKFDQRIMWLEQILDWKRKTPGEFLESLKVDLFEDEIVVFTPKGDPVILKEGSSPVDFAYEIHSSVGDHCLKAEVNKKLVALDTQLKSGDIVKIIIGKNTKPSRNWLSFVRTSKAKSKIRASLGIDADKDVKQTNQTLELDLAKYIHYEGKKNPVKISKCCNPSFGDNIIGFRTKEGTITVHKNSCPNIHTLGQDKKIEVKWNIPSKNVRTIVIYVNDRIGMIEDILNELTNLNVSLLSINIKPHKRKIKLTLKIKIEDKEQLSEIKKTLKGIKDILTLTVKWRLF